MNSCRVCGANCEAPVYRKKAPSLTSVQTVLKCETVCYFCSKCGHIQSPDVPELENFYNSDYKISLASDEFDQLYEFRDNRPIYRTEKQAELVLEHASPPLSARVLDYGAAKATTLRAICSKRKDILPHVIDVSEDYRSQWMGWVPTDAQATYVAPVSWKNQFDLITAHFVLEHVADPISTCREMTRLLAPDGKIFIAVPDFEKNVGDILVVDHINHFTEASINYVLTMSGLRASFVSREMFRGAFVIVAHKSDKSAREDTLVNYEMTAIHKSVKRISNYWQRAQELLAASVEKNAELSAVIYGAGFYGKFIASELYGRQKLLGYLDRNPHLRRIDQNLPIFDPLDAPETLEIVYTGLNPSIARTVIANWQEQSNRRNVKIVFLD